MTTTEINYDKSFQLFINKDDYREQCQKPFKYKDKYFASDGYGLMFLPTSEVELPYPEKEITSFSAVIEKPKTLNQEISVLELERKLIPEMIDEESISEQEEIIEVYKQIEGGTNHQSENRDTDYNPMI